MAATEERFQAAVNVIKGLPKDGPYQPSTTMMLRFYGLYKQATEGPCKQRKPNFWDVVGKAKWGAWNDNSHLTREQAMDRYVEDLREIIETMSFTENVQNFVGSLDGLENINLDELEMIMPGMRELAESHPSSPFNSRTNSPQHGNSMNNGGVRVNGDGAGHQAQTQKQHATMNGHAVHMNGHTSAPSDVDDDEEHTGSSTTTTTATTSTTIKPLSNHTSSTTTNSTNNNSGSNNINTNILAALASASSASDCVDQSDDEYGDPVDMNHELTQAINQNSELLKQIQATVLRMNADLVLLNQRMGQLEKGTSRGSGGGAGGGTAGGGSKSTTGGRNSRSYPKWWPFDDISPAWFVLLVLWPFVVRRLSRALATNSVRRK